MCVCTDVKTVPDKCELEILIDEMEFIFSGSHKLFAQSIRAAFHDAGTFDRNINEGGANGCLMNDPRMVLEPENNGLDLPVNILRVSTHAGRFVIIIFSLKANVALTMH